MPINKEWEKLEKRLSERIVYFANLLHLTGFQYKIEDCTDDPDMGKTVTTEISLKGYNPVYIQYYQGMMYHHVNKDPEGFDRLVLHELMHVMVSELSRLARDREATYKELDFAEERLCDNLSTVIHRIYASGQKQTSKNKSKQRTQS